jgi:LPS O-antigen subunit length determinant protein (WzzB/FepE family)
MINFSNGLNTVNIFEQQKRENLLESRFIDQTIFAYDQFINKLRETENVLPLYLEPKKYQMWHQKFDPHSD